MSKKRYVVRLTKREREDLSALIRRGKGKHGSWLNIAEIELRVLCGQCLDRRIAIRAELEREVQAWTKERNASIIGVDGPFTSKDARIQPKRLYPEFQT